MHHTTRHLSNLNLLRVHVRSSPSSPKSFPNESNFPTISGNVAEREESENFEKMMNVLALSLVLTSLVTAGVFSPTPEKSNQRDVIVKEGHRVVMVEYEKLGDGNTKVVISPEDAHLSHQAATPTKSAVDDAKEKIKEAASSAPNSGQGLSGDSDPQQDAGHSHTPGARELVCDAYGKCKHKIASAIGMTKEKVAEKAQEVSDKAYEVEEDAKEAVSEAIGKVKDTGGHKLHDAANKAQDKAHQAKETASQKARDYCEGVTETAKNVKDADTGTPKILCEHIERNVSSKVESAKGPVREKAKQAEQMAEEAADNVKGGARRVNEEGRKCLNGILGRGRDVLHYAITIALSRETMDSLMGLVNLLGFSTAFGMCVWVTFVSSNVLAGALPRQQFGMLQSKIYPVYFKAMAYAVGVALVGHLLTQRRRMFSSTFEILQGWNLLVSLLMVLANLLYLEPRATKVMFERMKMEKEEGRGTHGLDHAEPSGSVNRSTEPETCMASSTTGAGRQEDAAKKSQIIRMNEILKKLNTYSSFLNVLTLMALTWHLAYLGQRLHSVR
ncbi:hypothetical protein RJ639_021674 [Escallonia herrerae]|uniref:TMEM205-like domain-containing protein n=1 Tax=Escallonia herrerae TaxID=1293975 RepID=A0AA88V879_9ASTE|nr:hypothetical protein RJ639_021674 [Escallonia herrerae]